MAMEEELNRVSNKIASTQVEKELGRTGGSSNNQSRKKWLIIGWYSLTIVLAMEDIW